jgi:hypothetical protein
MNLLIVDLLMRETRAGLLGDSREERIQTVPAVVSRSVDEEAGRAVNASPDAALEILPHAWPMRTVQNFGEHTTGIKTQGGGIFSEVRVFQRVLIFEQLVVHFPKAALCAGRFGGFGGVGSMRVHVRQGEIAKSKA